MKLQSSIELMARIGTVIGVSEWVAMPQDMINRFADLTDDHQFIHVDPEAAAKTAFGGTIAHGFLVLSMLGKLCRAADFALQGVQMGVNYGFDRIRFMTPVRSGKRIRASFKLKDLIERTRGQWLATLAVSVEIEGEDKPAMVADWLCMQYVKREEGNG